MVVKRGAERLPSTDEIRSYLTDMRFKELLDQHTPLSEEAKVRMQETLQKYFKP